MKVAFFELNKSEIPIIEKRFKNTDITVIKTSTESLNHENVKDIKETINACEIIFSRDKEKFKVEEYPQISFNIL